MPIPYAITNAETGEIISMGMAASVADVELNFQVGRNIYFADDLPANIDQYRGAERWLDKPPRPSQAHTWVWAMHAWMDLRTLDDLRAAQWTQIKADRDAEEAGGFPYRGKSIDSDERSVLRITGAVQAAQEAMRLGAPFSIAWTCADNTQLLLDAEGMQAMPAALAVFAGGLHQRGVALRERLSLASTPDEVAAVTWASSLTSNTSESTTP